MSYRLEGASRAVRTAFPPAGEPVYVGVTLLGGPAALTFALAVLYWVDGRRRETALVVSYAFLALGAVLALKAWFALPRPPAGARLIAVEGYGFPSGHAAAAAVVYGGIAVEFGWLRDRDRARTALAAALVVAVAFSRVVLGVHYVGDVIAGAALGSGVVVLGHRLARGDPRRGFAAAAGPGVAALALAGPGANALGALGAALGGTLAAPTVEAAPESVGRARAAALVALGVPLVAVIQVAEPAFAAVPAGVALDDALLVATVLALPAAVERAGLARRLRSDGE